jgi:hypothetical protein
MDRLDKTVQFRKGNLAWRDSPAAYGSGGQLKMGTTSIEYAILLALIILVCFSAIASIGNPTLSGFQRVISEGGFGPPSPAPSPSPSP